MKKGKNVKLVLFDNIKSSYGTVDAKELKSVYINIQSWVIPKKITSNWDRVVSCVKREMKYTISEHLNQDTFKDHFIIDLDLRTSGIQSGKKSFFNLEITLYNKDSVQFKSNELKENIKLLIKELFHYNISNNKYFDFSKSKMDIYDKQSDLLYLS
jgi:hypothetical protein